MKNLSSVLVVIVTFLASVTVVSCKKSGTKPISTSILGNWKLVSDSSYVDGGNTPAEPHSYKGGPSDYYNFQSGGKLSWHENNGGSDSSIYSLKSPNTVTIEYLSKTDPNYSQNMVDTYTITVLTTNKMVLTLEGGPVVEDIMTFSK